MFFTEQRLQVFAFPNNPLNAVFADLSWRKAGICIDRYIQGIPCPHTVAVYDIDIALA